jgi:two-component system, sensor histidine kinase PdtaS
MQLAQLNQFSIMTKLILITMFLFSTAIMKGQTEIKNFLSQQQVADLRTSLSKNITDSSRINILLRLAKYHFEKGGNEKSDLDSAALFISRAKEINTRQTKVKRDGLLLFYEASLARRGGSADMGRQLINQAITQLKLSNDEFHLAEAYMELSRCYNANDPQQTTSIKNVFNQLSQHVPMFINQQQQDSCMSVLLNFYFLQMSNDSYDIKLDFLNHLARSYQLLNDKVHEFWARKEIADIHYNQGHLDLAINELLQIAKEQKDGNYPRICFTYDLLSGLYFAGANFNKALYYSLESIKNVSTAFDSMYLANFCERVAFNYSRTGSIAEAVDWNFKTLNYRMKQMQTGLIYSLMYDLTGDLINLGRTKEALNMILAKKNIYPPKGDWEKNYMLLSLAKCYAALKQNVMAEKYCEELIAFNELRMKRKEITSNVILNAFLANFYLGEGRNDIAEKYLRKTMDEWPKSGKDQGLLYQYNFLFKLDSAKGNYLSAIRHLHNYQLIKDSIQTTAKTKQIEELKIAYQTEQKDSLINLKEQNIQLLTKQDQLQKSKLKQDTILRNISFAAVALLIITMALLYNRYRLKQRTTRKLELQQNEITKQNFSLHNLVHEKEWLLKEIHHRVKNNLQVVMSLLNSQSAYIDSEAALTAIHDSQHRVHAMSLIHQKLYNSENVSSIDMSFYIRELVSYLADSFDTGQRIKFDLNIEPLQMDVSQAVPLGLILNEAITNALKYAFPDNRNGVISISLYNVNEGHYLLNISDNGVGIPKDSKNKGSLGMSLMKGLSEDLDGNFSIENNNGTIIKISFVHDKGVKKPSTLAASFVSNN